MYSILFEYISEFARPAAKRYIVSLRDLFARDINSCVNIAILPSRVIYDM